MKPSGPLLAAALALASPGAAPAHPGHEAPVPERPGETPPETHGDSAVRLARVVLERGSAGAAARMIAREAAGSATAARVLADALERLGDAEGAALARGRAAELEARGRP
ncbi:MAG TPA: hypothetical protein VN033_00605 [Vulgatibacter sp.]|nr:hypothetical protein [Vulgatibacter sp.]